MHAVRGGLEYFALVFSAGFLLGCVRVLVLVPRLGVRAAELLEMPFMLVVIWFAARRVEGRYLDGLGRSPRLGAGCIALALLVIAELLLAVGLSGTSVASYLASRDPVSGSVYAAMLVLFAIMPALIGRSRHAT